MRQVWHIFKKDVRRLRWEAAATLALLAWVAHLDRWRADSTPGAAEGWLNVLLPAAWAYLVGLLVLQDPLVGDREFWLTLPCRRRSLLGAKALFVLCFVHAPYFLAQAGILLARGFSPVAYFPQLMTKQLFLLVMLTLPSAAVAAMVENVVQFALAAVVLASAAVYAAGMPQGQLLTQTDAARLDLALLAVVVGAGAVVPLQYGRRRTAVSRGIGAAAAIAAVVAFAGMPKVTSAEVQCALTPLRLAAPASVTLLDKVEPLPSGFPRYILPLTTMNLALPMRISGLPPADLAISAQLSFDIRTENGERYSALSLPYPTQHAKTQLAATVWPVGPAPAYEIVMLDRTVYERLKGSPVIVEGSIMTELHQRGTTTRIQAEKAGDAPGLGKCTSAMGDGAFSQQGGLSVTCESPDEIPNPTYVTLMAPGVEPSRRTGLGAYGRVTSYPRSALLSPLNRRNAFIPLVAREDWTKNTGAFPQEDLSGAVVEIVPEPVAGRAILEYRWNGVLLSKFVVPAKP
ncbi:MAG TPA: hypothetical protein VMU19_06440 [Bryobacteraceae bacterium]|nr:hypothetical protein [Bryobacteraceae bacterium]